MDELIKLPFGVVNEVGPMNRLLDGRALWRHLANTAEQLHSMAGSATSNGDAASFQITLGSLVEFTLHLHSLCLYTETLLCLVIKTNYMLQIVFFSYFVCCCVSSFVSFCADYFLRHLFTGILPNKYHSRVVVYYY